MLMKTRRMTSVRRLMSSISELETWSFMIYGVCNTGGVLLESRAGAICAGDDRINEVIALSMHGDLMQDREPKPPLSRRRRESLVRA